MKRLISIIAVFSIVCFATMASAAGDSPKPSQEQPAATTQDSSNTIIGKVVSADKAKNVIVVTDQETKKNKTFNLKAKDIKPIKKGSLVKIILVPGTTDKVGSIGVATPEELKARDKK